MKTNDIHYFDFRNLNNEEFKEKINDIEIGTVSIFDIEGTFISIEIKQLLSAFLKNNSDSMHGLAFLGVGRGVRKLILKLIDFPLYIAEDRTDGEDWLLSL